MQKCFAKIVLKCLSIKWVVLSQNFWPLWAAGSREHLPIFEILPNISSFSLSLVAEQFHLTSLNWFWHSRIPLSAAVLTCFMWSNLRTNYREPHLGVHIFLHTIGARESQCESYVPIFYIIFVADLINVLIYKHFHYFFAVHYSFPNFVLEQI